MTEPLSPSSAGNGYGPLLPCPFCGGSATMEQTQDNRWSVGCDSADEPTCMGYQNFTTFARRGEAREAWNKRIRTDAQSVQVPMAYWVEHPTFGMELSLDPPNESAVQRGWVATPLYASQPSPAATVERVQTFAEAAAKIRATRIETTYNLAIGERDNEETDPAYFRSSAATGDDTDHIHWGILAEERLGQRPVEHGRHIPQTSPAPGCDSGSHSADTDERLAGGLVRVREFFERNPSLKESVCQIPACGIVTYGDLAALHEYADGVFEASFPNEPQQVEVTDEVLRLRAAMDYACDLLAERTFGSSARSPGHNARVHLESALSLSRPEHLGE